MHFTYRDRLWHLYTPDDLRQAAGEGKILHAPPNGATPFLLEVPIMPGSETLPMLRHLLSASPAEVIAARRTHLEKVDQTRCQQVWQKLTPRQREVLGLLASGMRAGFDRTRSHGSTLPMPLGSITGGPGWQALLSGAATQPETPTMMECSTFARSTRRPPSGTRSLHSWTRRVQPESRFLLWWASPMHIHLTKPRQRAFCRPAIRCRGFVR